MLRSYIRHILSNDPKPTLSNIEVIGDYTRKITSFTQRASWNSTPELNKKHFIKLGYDLISKF